MRLDLELDRNRLRQTVAFYRPRLLILDPFVRLHCIDENASGAVAPLLAYLRGLQRAFGTAIVVVHHARKRAGAERGGQALRGSSEFHAWGDSNLYLNRQNSDFIGLSIEHRAAKSQTGINLVLRDSPNEVALEIQKAPIEDPESEKLSTIEGRILAELSSAKGPVALPDLRNQCKMRKKSLCSALNVLVDKGLVVKLDGKFALTRSTIEMAAENLVPSSQPLGNAREPEPGTSFPEVSAEYF